MSAFFLAINRDKSSFEQAVAKSMMSAIDVFGHDQARLFVQDNFALGYQSHWSVPEEVGECQPLLNERAGVWSLFHGRVDNRATLIEALSVEMASKSELDDKVLSDAELMLEFYLRFGEQRLSSPIKDIAVLEPGTSIRLNAAQQQAIFENTFYSFDGAQRTVLENDQAYADQFKALLAQAVRRRARAISSVGSMLSGGYDSVPMSILMAQHLAEKGEQLTAFSWVFDEYKEADERIYSEQVCSDFKIKQVCIKCDHVWPKFDETTYVNPVMPFVVPYIELQSAALKSASNRGVKTILSGVHGDLLYGYTDSILWELVKAKRWNDAFKEARYRYRQAVSVNLWFKQYILRPLPWVQRLLERRRLKATPHCEWLSDAMEGELRNQPSRLWSQSIKSLRPIGHELVFGGFAGEDIAYGRHIDACYGVERRYPFRDRELCEFMLSVPSDQLNLFSVNRPLIKKAFAKELSPELLARNTKTSFYPAIKAGIEYDRNYRKWFDSEQQYWSFYVKKCYFNGGLAKKEGLDIVQWQCGYYDYWKSVCYDEVVIRLGLNDEKSY